MTLALLTGPWNISHAELSFNWTPRADIRDSTQGLPFAICNVAGQANQGNCDTNFFFSSPDKTPFVQEIVKDVNGAKYYHLIVGDPSQGFAQVHEWLVSNGKLNVPNQNGSSCGV